MPKQTIIVNNKRYKWTDTKTDVVSAANLARKKREKGYNAVIRKAVAPKHVGSKHIYRIYTKK